MCYSLQQERECSSTSCSGEYSSSRYLMAEETDAGGGRGGGIGTGKNKKDDSESSEVSPHIALSKLIVGQ